MADEIISRSQARAQGLKQYFTGKPCKRGHISPRSVASCVCKTCDLEKDRRWRDANREKMRRRERELRSTPGPMRDRMLERRKAVYEANKEQRREEARR